MTAYDLTAHRDSPPAAWRELDLLRAVVIEQALDHEGDGLLPVLQRIVSEPLTVTQMEALTELVDHFVDMARTEARHASDKFFELGVEAGLAHPERPRERITKRRGRA